jgi:hypothetical protein
VLNEPEIRKICEKIKAESKRDARYETGVLQRSIAFTIYRGVVTFRQIFYGKYSDNSKLEENCVKMMPRGVQWRIIYTDFGGKEVEVGRTRQGRATQRDVLGSLFKTTTSKIRALIARKKSKDGEKED